MKIYKGGGLIKKGDRQYVIVSSNEYGIEEIEINSCRGKDIHYIGEKGVCLVCGFLGERKIHP